MTGEEMERAIEFLLKSQANFEGRLNETNQQIARTDRQLEIFAETQSEFIQAMLRFTESQDMLNENMRKRQVELVEAQQRTEQRISELVESQQRTDQRISELAESQQRTDQRMSELAESQQRTHQEISELTKAVNNLIKFSSGNGSSRQE